MCGLFGFSDTLGKLTRRQKNRLTHALAAASEERGTDATGIAYNENGHLRIYKRPLRAMRMKFYIPEQTTAVLGHTRMTTQGSEKQNRNNHPFAGYCNGIRFALAHNGVLHNDAGLRKTHHLPHTPIETDSYAAVQLLEQGSKLNLASLSSMAEQLEGSFTLTLLDDDNTLYFIRGSSPLCIWHFQALGLFVYASTKDILKRAVRHTGFLNLPYNEIATGMGDILALTQDGKTAKARFDTTRIQNSLLYPSFLDHDWSHYLSARHSSPPHKPGSPMDELLAVAGSMGYAEEEVLMLFDEGYGYDEVTELMNDPCLFRACVAEYGWEIEMSGY